jgi:hypothetical protein
MKQLRNRGSKGKPADRPTDEASQTDSENTLGHTTAPNATHCGLSLPRPTQSGLNSWYWHLRSKIDGQFQWFITHSLALLHTSSLFNVESENTSNINSWPSFRAVCIYSGHRKVKYHTSVTPDTVVDWGRREGNTEPCRTLNESAVCYFNVPWDHQLKTGIFADDYGREWKGFGEVDQDKPLLLRSLSFTVTHLCVCVLHWADE